MYSNLLLRVSREGEIMNRIGLIMWFVRAVGLLVIAVAAVSVARSEGPQPAVVHSGADYQSHAGDLALVKAGDKLNQKNADNVYQQAVVNGWVSRDLLELQVKQLDELGVAASDTTYVTPGASDDRPVQLLMYAVIAMCWFGATTPGLWSKAPELTPSEPRDPLPAEA